MEHRSYKYSISREILEKFSDTDRPESFNAKWGNVWHLKWSAPHSDTEEDGRGKNDRICLTIAVHCRHVNNREAAGTKPGMGLHVRAKLSQESHDRPIVL